ncbi:IS5 family transposase [Klebsiella pneumoniae]|uniref:IS5 family transposase n=1 Tax=Klebsiella pneumoniae TaxID=573 RepID=UPI002265D1A9|nr:IS5 family transposase [Klebsiella pneumoniae]
MLRIHCMQHWYNLSDGAMEDALYEIASMRLFARLSRIAPAGSHHHHEFPPPARAASTGPSIVQDHQSLAGRSRRHDDPRHFVDATIIEAPSSTKNKEQQRDPEMHQTKKGNQWHFGMKAHIGVDAKSGLTHSLVTTAANEHDLNQLGNLLHGEEQFVSADAGYQGAPQRGAGRGGCGLADRRASRQGKT